MTSMVFVIIGGTMETNIRLNREIALTNYLMTAFPETVFVCRGTFLLTELFEPRSNKFWADKYLQWLNCCDALYCHDGDRRHPMADYANDIDLPIMDDQMDLELFLATASTVPAWGPPAGEEET